jgi:hypothetical protein
MVLRDRPVAVVVLFVLGGVAQVDVALVARRKVPRESWLKP